MEYNGNLTLEEKDNAGMDIRHNIERIIREVMCNQVGEKSFKKISPYSCWKGDGL